mmetsp:Transcript_5188/g.10352  ORF Transcript_5188/g.10352 Transcript_5188/m.10352 type:complete len:207 (+) Transcript_5188:66-686(+)
MLSMSSAPEAPISKFILSARSSSVLASRPHLLLLLDQEVCKVFMALLPSEVLWCWQRFHWLPKVELAGALLLHQELRYSQVARDCSDVQGSCGHAPRYVHGAWQACRGPVTQQVLRHSHVALSCREVQGWVTQAASIEIDRTPLGQLRQSRQILCSHCLPISLTKNAWLRGEALLEVPQPPVEALRQRAASWRRLGIVSRVQDTDD